MDHKDNTHATVPGQELGTIVDIKKFIIDRNRAQSEVFIDAGARASRKLYRTRHSTEIAALKCMDGRLNLSDWTETPVGIINPFRNIGGEFNLGWPYLKELIKNWVDFAILRGRTCLVLATYHFSKGDPHRGCKGFNYDTDAARKAASELVTQFQRVFGKKGSPIYPVLVGMETDDESLIIHDQNGNTFVVADHLMMPAEEICDHLTSLFPDMTDVMVAHLLELVQGNQDHVRRIREEMEEHKRLIIDLDHREQVIAVGTGFDSFHLPNKMLIIGPFSPEWPKAVVTAGKILLDNIEREQIGKDAGILLLVNALSRDEEKSYGWNLEIEKANFITDLAMRVLNQELPELTGRPNFSVLTSVVSASTRRMHVVE